LDNYNNLIVLTSEFPPGPGGIGNHAYHLVDSLSKMSFNVNILITQKCDEDLSIPKSKIESKFSQIWLKKKGSLISNYVRIFNIFYAFMKLNPCAIICSGRTPLILGGIFKLLFKKKLFFLIVHGKEINPSNKVLHQIIKLLINKYDKIVSVSNYTAKKLVTNFQKRSIVINNGIDPLFIKYSDSIRLKKNIERGFDGKLSLITVGRISDRKGQTNVIKAIKEIKKSYPHVHYHMVGLLDEKSKIKEEIENNHVKNCCTIHGYLEQKEMMNLIKKSHIFLMLSDHTPDGDFEGFGIAIIEANAYGIPAIGSKNSGIEDAIVDGVTGLLIESSNTSELLASIKKIDFEYNKFSARAKDHSKNLSWNKVIHRYLDAFDLINEQKIG